MGMILLLMTISVASYGHDFASYDYFFCFLWAMVRFDYASYYHLFEQGSFIYFDCKLLQSCGRGTCSKE
jgi:hypothetical protein